MTPNIEEMFETLENCSQKIDNLNNELIDIADLSKQLFNTIKLTNEYNKELKTMNNHSIKQKRSSLISTLENERKTIRDLESENQELQAAIQHHQQVLSIIMGKYREQNTKLDTLGHLEESYQIADDIVNDRHKHFRQKTKELVPLMDSGCVFDQTLILSQQELKQKVLTAIQKIKSQLNSQLIQVKDSGDNDPAIK